MKRLNRLHIGLAGCALAVTQASWAASMDCAAVGEHPLPGPVWTQEELSTLVPSPMDPPKTIGRFEVDLQYRTVYPNFNPPRYLPWRKVSPGASPLPGFSTLFYVNDFAGNRPAKTAGDIVVEYRHNALGISLVAGNWHAFITKDYQTIYPYFSGLFPAETTRSIYLADGVRMDAVGEMNRDELLLVQCADGYTWTDPDLNTVGGQVRAVIRGHLDPP